MQKTAPHNAFVRNSLVAAAILSLSAVAGHALAECDEDQEAAAGKAVAVAAGEKVSAAVTVQGKQMVNIDACEPRLGVMDVSFKYNFLGADGLYWVQGSAKVKGAVVSEFKVTQMSPNLAAASAAKGVKLASN